MKEDTKTEVARILAQYEQAQAARRQQSEKSEADRTAFPTRFNTLARDVIGPTLEQFRRQMIEKGHDADVEFIDHDEAAKRKGKVTFYLIPKGWTPVGDPRRVPNFSFVADYGSVKVEYDKVGEAGAGPTLSLDKVTAAVIEEQAVALLRKVLVGER